MNKLTISLLFLIFTSNVIKTILPKEKEEKKNIEDNPINQILYSIEVLNSNLENSTIKLIPGIFEKIYIKVTKLVPYLHLKEHVFDLELNSSEFKLNNIDNKVKINTKENSFFEIYIGIPKVSEIKEYELSFKVIPLDKKLFNIKTFKIEVLDEKTEINFELLEKEISNKAYSFIKFNLNDIYPIEPTRFNVEINKEDEEYIEIEKEIKIENKEKKSLLKYRAKKYDETKNTFKITISSDNDYIIPKYNEFTIIINNETNPKFTNDIQKEIISNVKIVEAKEENAIEIDMSIPYGGLFIECDAKYGKGNDFNFTDKNENNIENDKKELEKNYKVKDYIKKNNMTEYKLIFSNLYRLGVYRVKCDFTPTYIESHKFKITFGFSEEADIKVILRPNSFYHNLPQCIDFYFDKNEKLTDFNSSLIEYFYSQQNNTCVTITERDLNSIFKYDNEVKSFCIDINPLCHFKNVKGKTDDITKILLDKINTNKKINETLGIEIKNEFTYKIVKDDKIPDKSLIKVTATKEINNSTNHKNQVNILIKVKNENENPIICQYNDLKKEREKSRWINPLNFQHEKYIKNNEEIKLLETTVHKDDTMYSIILNCGNLPGYKYHYYTTGPYVAGSVYVNKEDEEDYEKKEKKNCNKDWFNPECVAKKHYEEKKKNKKEIEHFKSDIPKIIDDVLDEISDFGYLDLKDQRAYLKKQKDELKDKIKGKETKEIVKQVYKMFKQMLKNECYNSENYDECRKEKKTIIKETLNEINNIFKCNTIINDIQNIDENNSFVENVKVVLALISSASENSDSLNKGDSQILYDLSYCVLDKYEDIWKKTLENIKQLKYNETEKLNIQKDIIELIIKSIGNLMDVIKYDEVDKFLENYNIKNLTQILVSQTAKKLKKKIHQASKLLWRFGNGNYSLENIDINITQIDERESEEEKKIFDFPEHGIKLRIKKKKLLKKFKADLMQILIYRNYPHLSVNSTQSENKFISIRFFKGDNEINVTDINNDDRPEILFDKNKMKFNKCVYFNESYDDLKNDGIDTENEKDNIEYILCKVKHFTDFSISNSQISDNDNNENKSNFWRNFLIIFFVIILIAGGIIVFMKMRNPVINSDIDTDKIPNEKIVDV